ncbi:MAG TPA: hypothetical protein EYN73_03705 [Chromatiaceae bacterium]|nr:hypothetical protein [Chromatiaceae bacterium]HIO53543.1 hypothetical protein [Chromatiales bacterium]
MNKHIKVAPPRKLDRWSGIIGLALFAGVCHAAPNDLKTTVQEVLQGHPEVREIQETWRATQTEIAQAEGGKRPIIDFRGAYGGERTDDRSIVSTSVDRVRSDAELKLVLPLYDGGLTRAEVSVANHRTDGDFHRIDTTGQVIALRVIRAFLDVLQERELFTIARQSETAFDRHRQNERSRLDGGFGSIADFEQAVSRHALSQVRTTDAQEQVERASTGYRSEVGDAPGDLTMPALQDHGRFSDFNQAMALAKSQHPLLRLQKTEIDVSSAEQTAAGAPMRPKLNLEANVLATNDAGGFNGKEYDARMQMVVRWNLYNGGRDRQRLRKAAFNVDVAQQAYAVSYRAVEQELRLAFSSLKANQDNANRLQKRLNSSRKVLDAYASERRLGSRSSLDLLTAETDLFNAETDAATVRYNILFDQYRLLAASGQLLDEFSVELQVLDD